MGPNDLSNRLECCMLRRTVEAARNPSSKPILGLIANDIKILIAANSKTNDRPHAVMIMIHAVLSVLVDTANGAFCPGGTVKGEDIADIVPSAMAARGSVWVITEGKFCHFE
jgi:hypothetical protein